MKILTIYGSLFLIPIYDMHELLQFHFLPLIFASILSKFLQSASFSCISATIPFEFLQFLFVPHYKD